MTDPQLNAIANKIQKQTNIPEEEKFGSVIAILMIISLVLTLIRILQECNKNKLTNRSTQQDKYSLYGSEIKNYTIKRGFFTKLRIKKIIKQQMSKEQYEKYGFELLNAILDTGSNLNNEEVMTLVEAANV